jgi:hypothetical protein
MYFTHKTKETIKKLQEYRTALISAAVTGKLDVRQGVGVSVKLIYWAI